MNNTWMTCGSTWEQKHLQRGVLTDEFESEVFVGSRLFGMFVEKHDGASDPAVLQRLLTHAGQLQGGNTRVSQRCVRGLHFRLTGTMRANRWITMATRVDHHGNLCYFADAEV